MATVRGKLELAKEKAAAILDARPDAVLADIARKAGVSSNLYNEDQCAISFNYPKDGEMKFLSWPIDFLPKEITDLGPDEIARLFVAVLDETDAREKIDR